jgi:hypothetical protein
LSISTSCFIPKTVLLILPPLTLQSRTKMRSYLDLLLSVQFFLSLLFLISHLSTKTFTIFRSLTLTLRRFPLLSFLFRHPTSPPISPYYHTPPHSRYLTSYYHSYSYLAGCGVPTNTEIAQFQVYGSSSFLLSSPARRRRQVCKRTYYLERTGWILDLLFLSFPVDI